EAVHHRFRASSFGGSQPLKRLSGDALNSGAVSERSPLIGIGGLNRNEHAYHRDRCGPRVNSQHRSNSAYFWQVGPVPGNDPARGTTVTDMHMQRNTKYSICELEASINRLQQLPNKTPKTCDAFGEAGKSKEIWIEK
ncbi:unnamed protein product, partial [Ectocarpus sp. 4 AP-2014]